MTGLNGDTGVVARLHTPMALAFDEMTELRAEFAAYCDEQGYLGHPDPIKRLLDLGAAFAWLVSTDPPL